MNNLQLRSAPVCRGRFRVSAVLCAVLLGGVFFSAALVSCPASDNNEVAAPAPPGPPPTDPTTPEPPPPPPRAAGVYVGAANTPVEDTATLREALTWIELNMADGSVYTIVLDQDDAIGASQLYYDGKQAQITLEGAGATRTVQLTGTGSLFTIGSKVSLKLGNGIKLIGVEDNTAALLYVTNGGSLEVGAGAVVTGNTSSSTTGGGICAYATTACLISGGEISGNAAKTGGGVYIDGSGAQFEMSSGKINGNRSTAGGGAGLFVRNYSTGVISGGQIYGNIASGTGGNSAGAGLRLTMAAVLTMTDGSITGNVVENTNAGGGGGVFIGNDGTKMEFKGGTIENNETRNTAVPNSYNLYREQGSFLNESGQTLNAENGFVF